MVEESSFWLNKCFGFHWRASCKWCLLNLFSVVHFNLSYYPKLHVKTLSRFQSWTSGLAVGVSKANVFKLICTFVEVSF